MNCFRRGDPIKEGEQLIEVETDQGRQYAHEGCVPSCPKCRRPILPDGRYKSARSSGMKDHEQLPIVEHVICLPY